MLRMKAVGLTDLVAHDFNRGLKIQQNLSAVRYDEDYT